MPMFEISKNTQLEKFINELSSPKIHLILYSSDDQAIEEFRVDLSEIHYIGKRVKNYFFYLFFSFLFLFVLNFSASEFREKRTFFTVFLLYGRVLCF
jgi:hypothetical protein